MALRKLNKLRNGRLQAREGGRWARNDAAKDLGLAIEVCPHCQAFNPRSVLETPALRCHACAKPMLPACAEHGEAACGAECRARPCEGCGQDRRICWTTPFVDPMALRRGGLCRTCGRPVIAARET